MSINVQRVLYNTSEEKSNYFEHKFFFEYFFVFMIFSWENAKDGGIIRITLRLHKDFVKIT